MAQLVNTVNIKTVFRTCYVIVWFVTLTTRAFSADYLQKSLTYDKANDIAKVMEAAEKGSRSLLSADQFTTVHFTAGRSVRRPHINQQGNASSANKPANTAAYYRCGGNNHLPSVCQFKESTCHKCSKKGHLAKVCRSTVSGNKLTHSSKQLEVTQHHSHYVTSDKANDIPQEEDDSYTMFAARTIESNPIMVTCKLEGVPVNMELDTGAALTVIDEDTLYKIFKSDQLKLEESKVKLKTYTGELIPLVGKCTIQVQYGGKLMALPLVVAKGASPNLLGRDWLNKFDLNPLSVHSLGEQDKSL